MTGQKPRIVLIALYNYDFGVRSISSFLKTKGYEPVIIFFKHKRYCEEWMTNDFITPALLSEEDYFESDCALLLSSLEKIKPEIIGISLTSTMFAIARRITQSIKKRLGSLVVWGGVHAIICPEECIGHADAVCVGEGEYVLWKIAERIQQERSLDGIEGLWVKHSGEISKALPMLIDDLDALPYPDFFDRGNKFLVDSQAVVPDPPVMFPLHSQGYYPIMTSRGCLFNCSFCCNATIKEQYRGQGRYFRRRSVKNVLAELRLAVERYPFIGVRFWDDVFTHDLAWTTEFCEEYVRLIGKPFICYAHPSQTAPALLDKLIRSGASVIHVGLQSGSARVAQSVFQRRQTNRDIIAFAQAMKRYGVYARYDLITDNPFENEDDFDETVDLLLSLPRPYQVRLYSLCYFPKTLLTTQALENKSIVSSEQEQYAAKALNNFLLFLPLVRNKTIFFRDLVVALAVHRWVPAWFVNVCRKSFLVRQYPRQFFMFIRIFLRWLRFMKRVPAGKLNFRKAFYPRWRHTVGLYHFKDELRKKLLRCDKKDLARYVKPADDIFLVPSNRSDVLDPCFRLTIERHDAQQQPVALRFELLAAHACDALVATWDVVINGGSPRYTSDIIFRFPSLYFTRDTKDAVCSHCQKSELAAGQLYILQVSMPSRVAGEPVEIANRVVFTASLTQRNEQFPHGASEARCSAV